jgi:hypothetical protein
MSDYPENPLKLYEQNKPTLSEYRGMMQAYSLK